MNKKALFLLIFLNGLNLIAQSKFLDFQKKYKHVKLAIENKEHIITNKLLEKNKDKLTELAEVLLEKEVIFKDNLEKIFGKRPFDKKEDTRIEPL